MAEKEKFSHECVLCNSVFESKEDLQLHFRKHANKEIQDNCATNRNRKRVFKKESSPIPNEEKANPIACDVCGEEFPNSPMAIKHKFKKHPGASVKYICPYCGKQFPIKGLFDNHIGSHSSDTSNKSSLLCEECGAEFYYQKAKDYHTKLTHTRVKTLIQPLPTPPPSKKIKVNIAGDVQSVYYCHICGCEYVIKFNLQIHLWRSHTEEERNNVPSDLIRCTACDALFYNQKAYETHNILHKPDDLYVSSEEQRLQAVSRVDQDFDIRRVLPVGKHYTPYFKRRRRRKVIKCETKQEEEEEEEPLSPPSTPDSSDSETEKGSEFKDSTEVTPSSYIKEEKKETDCKEEPSTTPEASEAKES